MPNRLTYDDYLRKVAQRFANRFEDIAAGFNFELGVEFEITLCRVLRQVLPQRYGICRGYVVTQKGEVRGDDVIIYDRDNFPTLRMLEQEGFERKESIPLEAVYAYIEAKHTLHVEGTDPQSVANACRQVRAVKCLPRDPVSWSDQGPYVARPQETVDLPTYWPPTRNQMYGAVIARYVRARAGGAVLTDAEQVMALLASPACSLGAGAHPDLLVAGPDVVCLPTINHGFHSPFQIERKSRLSSRRADGLAFGVGVCTMLFALDMMKLGGMPWAKMIAESVGLRMVRENQRGNIELPFGLPCYVVCNQQGASVQTVGTTNKTYLAIFTTADNAKAWLPHAEGTGNQVRAIESEQELRRLLRASARDAIDELALDAQPGSSNFNSIHIAFFLEDLDQRNSHPAPGGTP